MANNYRSAMEKIIVTPEMQERILNNLSSQAASETTPKHHTYQRWIRYAGSFAACCAVVLSVTLNDTYLTDPNVEEQSTQNAGSTDCSNRADALPESRQAMTTAPVDPAENTQPDETQKQPPTSSGNAPQAHSDTHKAQPSAATAQSNQGGTSAQAPASSSSDGKSDPPADGSSCETSNPMEQTQGMDELKKKVPFPLLVPTDIPSEYQLKSTSVISGELAQIIYSDGTNEITYRQAKGTADISGDTTAYAERNIETIADAEVTLKGDHSLITLATWSHDGYSYSLSFSSGFTRDNVVSLIGSIQPT